MAKKRPAKPARAKPAKRPLTKKIGRPRRVSDDQILAAIASTGGLYEAMAKKLGITRQAVNKRVKGNEQFEAAVHDARESMVDMAEGILFAAIRKGCKKTAQYICSRLGKARGYSTQLKVDANVHNTGELIILTLPDDGRDTGGNNGGTVSS